MGNKLSMQRLLLIRTIIYLDGVRACGTVPPCRYIICVKESDTARHMRHCTVPPCRYIICEKESDTARQSDDCMCEKERQREKE